MEVSVQQQISLPSILKYPITTQLLPNYLPVTTSYT